jgi:Zn-dependent M28 family amino/carboxypeptidase
LQPQSQVTDVTTALQWRSTRHAASLRNIGYLVTGSDAGWRNETVILGAHRDHFGRQAGVLFPGADDNASGTAVMLEVARAMAQAGVRTKRSVLFLSFSGEEQGLLGSRWYVRAPPRRLEQSTALVNVDHTGIGNGRLTVGVTGLEKSVAVDAGRLAGLSDGLEVFGFFPGGDHVPFKEAGIPTITVVSSGVHPHFHQPADRADTVSAEIMTTAARYVLALTWRLANLPKP